MLVFPLLDGVGAGGDGTHLSKLVKQGDRMLLHKKTMFIKTCFKAITIIVNNAVITETRKGVWRCRLFEHIQHVQYAI